MATEQSPLLKSDGSIDDEARHLDSAGENDLSESAIDAIQAKPTQSLYTVLPVLFLGVLISNMDETIVLASGNTIASEFDALSRSGWLMTSYSLAICAVQPMYGRFSQELGRKRVLLFCYLFFTTGCFLSTIAPTFWIVLAGRVVAGFGAAGMTSLVFIIIADTVPARQIGNWRSFVNVGATIGRSIGGPIGGLFTDKVSWRWAFGIQCPMILIAALLVLWRLPSHYKSETYDREMPIISRLARLDYGGAVLLSGTIVTFLVMLIFAGTVSPWTVPCTIALGIASIALGISFVVVEKQRPDDAIFPLRLFSIRDIITAYFLVVFQYGAQYSVVFTIPLYYQISDNVSSKTAGLYLVPTIIGNALGSACSGYAIYRTGRYKLQGLLAIAAACLGYLLMIVRWQGNASIFELGYSVLGAFGGAVISSTAFMHLTASLTSPDFAIAGIGLFTSHNIGASAGISVVTALLQHSLAAQLQSKLHGVENKQEIIERSAGSLAYVHGLTGQVRAIVVAAYLRSLTLMHGVSLVLSALAFVVAACIQEHPF